MKMIKLFVVSAVAVCLMTACEPAANTNANRPAANSNVNSNVNTNANSTAAAPTKEALIALDRSAYDAWKNKDAKFWDPFLAANFVGFNNGKRLDRAAAIKSYSNPDCDVKSVALSDEQMTPMGPNAALITYKSVIDATCGGQKIPANSWVAGVYVREGGQWKGAFHADTPIPDPNAKPAAAPAAKPAVKPAANTAANTAPSSAPDAATDAMFALEKKAWEAWKSNDQKGLEDWASANLVSFTSNGRQPRAEAIKTWMNSGCEIKSVSLTDPASMSFGPDFALLTFKSAADGKCGGIPVGSEHGASIYAKEGGTWKALFTMGAPMM